MSDEMFVWSDVTRSWLRVTHHAQLRMGEMEVDAPELELVLADPEITYRSRSDRLMVGAGRLLLVVAPATQVIVTVLPKTTAPYQRAA